MLGVTVHRYTDPVSMLPVTAVHGATIADVLTAQSALAAVSDLTDRAEHGVLRWADPLPVPEWVEHVRTAVTLPGNLNAFDVSRQHLTGDPITDSAKALEKTDTNIPRHHVTAVADWLRKRARTATSGGSSGHRGRAPAHHHCDLRRRQRFLPVRSPLRPAAPPKADQSHPADDGGVPRQAAQAADLPAAPGRMTPAEGLPPRPTHTVDRSVGRHLSTISDRRSTHSTRGSTTA